MKLIRNAELASVPCSGLYLGPLLLLLNIELWHREVLHAHWLGQGLLSVTIGPPVA